MNVQGPRTCENGIALGKFPLISLAVVLRSVLGFGVVAAYIVLWGVAGTRSINTTIGLILYLSIIPVVLIGLPSIVIAIGLMQRRTWAVWTAIVHDGIILPLFVGFYLPPFGLNTINMIWTGALLVIGLAFLVEAYFLLDFFCERRMVWTVLISVAVISFGLGLIKAAVTGGFNWPKANIPQIRYPA